MNILQSLYDESAWLELIEYKKEHQHLSRTDEDKWSSYIEDRRYIPLIDMILSSVVLSEKDIYENGTDYPPTSLPLPLKREINKSGSTKKRVIYSYPDNFNRLLKMIAFKLYTFDDIFAPNCYAFRRGLGVKDAVKRVQRIVQSKKYCLKVDISNYFNSIDVNILLEKLDFIEGKDPDLFRLFEKLLTADAAVEYVDNTYIDTTQTNTVDNNHCFNIYASDNETDCISIINIIHEKRGAMAGTPISPFFANVYLKDVDWYFHNNGIDYFRYSDDILIFADTYEELMEYKNILYKKIEQAHLTLNPDKVRICKPGEPIEFLGLRFENSEIDISDNTKNKMKARIKRKSESLRRWARKKHLSGEKAAKGFIKVMNHKFYDSGNDNDFSWSRWFFPNLTTVKSLSTIDTYMQEYIRYCVTGRHYKGNYRITYDQMKAWGYRNLVNEYYRYKSYS